MRRIIPIDVNPLEHFLKKNDIILTVQNTPWGFFWKEDIDWPGIVKYGDRILFNLKEYYLYSMWFEEGKNDTFHLWLEKREKVLHYLAGKVTMAEYHTYGKEKRLLYKAEVFPISEERIANFRELSIPIKWRKWCPLSVWPEWAIEAARQSVLRYIKEQKFVMSIIEYALSYGLISWVPESSLLRSIKLSGFDWDTLKKSRRDLFDYFMQTIIDCGYQKLITTVLV